MAALDLSGIQGGILRGYNFPRAVHLLVSMPDAAAGRAFLSEIVGEIRDAGDWGPSAPETVANIAVTFTGLQRLGVAERILSELPTAFREPMHLRAPRILDDTGPSHPDGWEPGLGDGSAHFLLLVAARDERPLEHALAAVQERLDRLGIETVNSQRHVRALDNQREHFGWADGFGQPAIEGTGGSRAGQGVPLPEGRGWRAIKAGEFIHGYADEDDQVIAGPAVPLLRNGSYLVYRKLRQDVALFRRAVQEEAERYRELVGSALAPDQLYELVAAKLVGRWRDGMALELVERRSDANSRSLRDKALAEVDNDFRYGDDRNGMRCPLGAHIRRANPRDTPGWGGTMSKRHRIIRRGMPYGDPLPAGEEDDGDRGLIFMCFNADFERQFELIQAQWCNDGNAFGLGNDKDWLLGDAEGTGKVTIQGRPPYFALARPGLVQTRGCEYLLMPGLDALRDLAEPRPDLGRR